MSLPGKKVLKDTTRSNARNRDVGATSSLLFCLCKRNLMLPDTNNIAIYFDTIPKKLCHPVTSTLILIYNQADKQKKKVST